MANSGPHDNGTGGQPVPHIAPTASVPAMPLDARSMKARMFSAERKKVRSTIIEFFGEMIEIRQPTVNHMMRAAKAMNAADDDDGMNQGTFILLNYAFVPGTDQHVFDDTDQEAILSLPYGDDFLRAIRAFSEITSNGVETEVKNSEKTNSTSK